MKKRWMALCTMLCFSLLPLSAQVKLSAPPMGWNSFDSYGVYLHEKAAFDNLYVMAKQYKSLGYEYFTIDNGWFGEYRLKPGTLFATEKHASEVHINEYGLLQPSATYFPHGFEKLISECHRLGLKFGVHLMRGIPRKAVLLNTPVKGTRYRARDIADTVNVCRWCHYNYGVDMSKPGAQEFYNSLIDQLASWGVDFIKYDDIVPYPKEVEAVARAIARCGRKIVLSLSPGDKVYPEALKSYQKADMLRVTHDIWDNRRGIQSCFAAWKKWSGTPTGGLWMDMDMIPFGQLQLMSPRHLVADTKVALAGLGNTRMSRLTRSEMRTFITLRALSASPLIIGGNLPTMDDFSFRLLTNREMIRANQNGIMGSLVYEQDGIQVWNTPERNGRGGWFGIFNLTEKVCRKSLPLEVLTRQTRCRRLYDVWSDRKIKVKAHIEIDLAPYDVCFVRYK